MPTVIRRGIRVARLRRAAWRKSRYSGQYGACVEAAALEDGDVAVRNSRDPDGVVLVLSRREMAALLARVKNGELDRP